MKLFTGLTKLASVPPHANIVEYDGARGYWVQNGLGHYVFLREKDGRVWAPRSLRGKSPQDLLPADFEALPKEDTGKSHYELWREDFNHQRSMDKIYDGYHFTPMGTELVERLRKYILKCKLDNVAAYGLDAKYSINPVLFDKMLQQTHLDKVRTMGRTIAKKYRMIVELLRAAGKKKLADRFDRDFYYHYNKLEPIFDFDAAKYKPEKAEPEPDSETPQQTLESLTDEFIKQVKDLLDPQMTEFMQAETAFKKVVHKGNIPQAQKLYEQMASILMKYIGRMHHHPMGAAAEQIIQHPTFVLLHHRLFEDAT